jgi:glutamate 5-kinase
VVRSGIPLIVASGLKPDAIGRIVAAKQEGTMFVPRPGKMKGRKRWIAFFNSPKGALVVDDGAKQALREGGKSLLPPGIVRCEGSFAPGDIVRIRDVDGTEFARGIVDFTSVEIASGNIRRSEVVHRDNLVIL